MKHWGKYLFLLVLILASAEGMARFTSSSLTKVGILYDPSLISQSYTEYLAQRDPQLGWSRLERFPTNSDGSRPDPGFPPSLPNCISAFGDSFTYGEGHEPDGRDTPEDKAWTAQLSRKLGCRVANFGVSAYGSDQAFLRYRSMEPVAKVVMLNHLSENILRNVTQFRNLVYPSPEFGFKPRFVLENDRLQLVPLPDIPPAQLNSFLSDPGRFLSHEYYLPGGPEGISRLASPELWTVSRALITNRYVRSKLLARPRHADYYTAGHPSGGLAVTAAIMEAFAHKARQRGQQPVLTIFPMCQDLKDAQKHGGVLSYSALTDRLVHAKLTFIDFGAEILKTPQAAAPDALYDFCGGHFNARGYSVVADIAADWFTKHGTAVGLLTAR